MNNNTLLLFIAVITVLVLGGITSHYYKPPAQEAVEFKLCCPAEVCYLATVVSQTDWHWLSIDNENENLESYPVLDTRCSHNLDEVRRYAEHHRGHKHHVMITKLARTESGIAFEGIQDE